MAITKGQVRTLAEDYLARKLDNGDRQIEGVFALRGPSPYLRIGLLAMVWTLLPLVVLPLWKFRFLAVTRDAVVVLAISKFTLHPRRIESITPRDRVRIDDVRGDREWTRLMLTDVDGVTHRYNVSRPFRVELDAVLAAVGAPPRPLAPEAPAGRHHPAKHGR